ncbi:MAG: aminoglycoside phosphotransferase family protein [Candidatus Peribacteraceae bacterium]|nr:aminoglycoside phosphotransferase family protein [Candidatus Peribacteraceae bacterium]
MKVEPYIERIRKEFPHILIERHTVPKQGMDHVAIVINDTWVFRFPHRKEYFSTFGNELSLLEELNKTITSLQIPNYTLMAKDKSFGGYSIIQGIECTAEVFEKLSKEEKDAASTKIASFLTELHTIPLEGIEKCGIEKTDYVQYLRNLEKEYEAHLVNHLSKNEQENCKQFFTEYAEMIAKAPTTLIHGDFYWWHLLINPSTNTLSGVIDFADSCFSDPSRDFAGLWIYGSEFAQSIFSQYHGMKDDQFLYRSVLGFQKLGISEMAYAVKGEFGNVQDAYKLLKKAIETKKEFCM